MLTSYKLRLMILFLVLGCTVGCDQTSKHFARIGLGESGYISLPGGFGELRLAENSGSFLSLGSSLPQSLRLALFIVGTGAVLIALFVYLVAHARLNWLVFLGLSLFMAGGMSNLIDRITRQGFVTDFIFLRVGSLHTGIFNVADTMIMLGAAVLACALWQQHASQKSAANLSDT